jgi:ATP-dependent Clp protease protease subunit
MNPQKKFWKWVRNKTPVPENPSETTESRTLFLNGTIAEESWFDDDVTPALFRSDLENGTGDITVWVNSPGGDCFAAAQIYNMLRDYKGKVTVKVDGLHEQDFPGSRAEPRHFCRTICGISRNFRPQLLVFHPHF